MLRGANKAARLWAARCFGLWCCHQKFALFGVLRRSWCGFAPSVQVGGVPRWCGLMLGRWRRCRRWQRARRDSRCDFGAVGRCPWAPCLWSGVHVATPASRPRTKLASMWEVHRVAHATSASAPFGLGELRGVGRRTWIWGVRLVARRTHVGRVPRTVSYSATCLQRGGLTRLTPNSGRMTYKAKKTQKNAKKELLNLKS